MTLKSVCKWCQSRDKTKTDNSGQSLKVKPWLWNQYGDKLSTLLILAIQMRIHREHRLLRFTRLLTKEIKSVAPLVCYFQIDHIFGPYV